MLDVAFPPSASQLVADCHAAGADSVGLYAYNASVPGSMQDSAYVETVLAGGIAVLPIIVPGNGSPSLSDIQVAIKSWSPGPNTFPVVLDIETGSSPMVSWIEAAINSFRSDGYPPGVYCNPSSYAVAIADQHGAWKWRADWTFRQAPPPPGWEAWQYSDNEIVNGTRYDISTVNDNLQFLGGLNMSELDDIRGVLYDASGAHPDAWIRQFLEGLKNSDITSIKAELDQLVQTVSKLTQPQVDASVLAKALLAEIGKVLSNG